MAKSKLVDPVKPIYNVDVVFETEKFQMKTMIDRSHSRYNIGQYLRVSVVQKNNKYFVWMLDEQNNVVYSLSKIEHDKKFATRNAKKLFEVYND